MCWQHVQEDDKYYSHHTHKSLSHHSFLQVECRSISTALAINSLLKRENWVKSIESNSYNICKKKKTNVVYLMRTIILNTRHHTFFHKTNFTDFEYIRQFTRSNQITISTACLKGFSDRLATSNKWMKSISQTIACVRIGK